jgi:ferrous iron transport protein A
LAVFSVTVIANDLQKEVAPKEVAQKEVAMTSPAPTFAPLSLLRPGQKGRIAAISEGGELERRLVEMGFIEGAMIEVLHKGPFGSALMAVLVDRTRIALRHAEAACVSIDCVAA